MNEHICQPQFAHMPSMREFYAANNMLATSTIADTALIRSHIAYHAGQQRANEAIIKPSRGHSYRVSLYPTPKRPDWRIVRIRDHYDHRNGVEGLFSVGL